MSISTYLIERAKLDVEREPPHLFPGNRWSWLPDLCNEFGLLRGAEIGVSGGRFSQRLLQAVPGLHLHAIDPWQVYDHYESRVPQSRMDATYRRAADRLGKFDNCTIVRDFSPRVAARFEDGSLDFVYIDANRRLNNVLADLAAWSLKVRPGGLVSGCCYYDKRDPDPSAVKAAVDIFTRIRGIDPWFVLVHHRYPCYLWEKR